VARRITSRSLHVANDSLEEKIYRLNTPAGPGSAGLGHGAVQKWPLVDFLCARIAGRARPASPALHEALSRTVSEAPNGGSSAASFWSNSSARMRRYFFPRGLPLRAPFLNGGAHRLVALQLVLWFVPQIPFSAQNVVSTAKILEDQNRFAPVQRRPTYHGLRIKQTPQKALRHSNF
jgi:hypothetical protein